MKILMGNRQLPFTRKMIQVFIIGVIFTCVILFYMTLYSRSCDSKVSHSTLPKTSTPIQSSVAASSQSTPTSQSQSLKTQEPIKEYDIVLNHFTINETNNTYNLLLNSLQRNLSQYLFKPHTLQLIQEDLKEFLNAKVIEQNFAILKHFTQVNSNQGKSLQEFSILSTAFTQLHFIQNFAPIMDNLKFTSSEPSLLLKYERDLYPWLLNSIEHLSSSFRGKGIVITTGNFHFKLALLLVKTLRNVLNCTLPIEVTIANQQDLRSNYQAELSKFSNLKIVDLSLLLKENELKGVNGWWFKAYSILLSSFAQVIFMDADVLFMVDPNLLFNSKVFEEYGVMIFRDRQIHLGNDYENLVKAFPFASNTLKNTALWQKSSTHEAESGVLVYDKMRKSAFYALLATCNLAREPMQKHVTEFFHGDKETFWMGFELLNLPYAFMQPYGATVGYQSTQGTVCGSLAHSDEQGNLLWFNGGLAVDKGSRADEIYDFKYWATDMGKIGEWTWEAGHLEKLCWTSQDPETQVKMMSSGQKRLIEKYVEFYKLSRKNLNY